MGLLDFGNIDMSAYTDNSVSDKIKDAISGDYKDWAIYSGAIYSPVLSQASDIYALGVDPFEGVDTLGNTFENGTFLIDPENPYNVVKIGNGVTNVFESGFIPTDENGVYDLYRISDQYHPEIATLDSYQTEYKNSLPVAGWDDWRNVAAPVIMAGIAAATGGAAGLASAGLGSTAAGAIGGAVGGATSSVPTTLQTGSLAPMLTGAALGGVTGGIGGYLSGTPVTDSGVLNTGTGGVEGFNPVLSAEDYATQNIGNVFYDGGFTVDPSLLTPSIDSVSSGLTGLGGYVAGGLPATTAEDFSVYKYLNNDYAASSDPYLAQAMENGTGLLDGKTFTVNPAYELTPKTDYTFANTKDTAETLLKKKLKDTLIKKGTSALVKALSPSVPDVDGLLSQIGTTTSITNPNYKTTSNSQYTPVQKAAALAAMNQAVSDSKALQTAKSGDTRQAYLKKYIPNLPVQPSFLNQYLA